MASPNPSRRRHGFRARLSTTPSRTTRACRRSPSSPQPCTCARRTCVACSPRRSASRRTRTPTRAAPSGCASGSRRAATSRRRSATAGVRLAVARVRAHRRAARHDARALPQGRARRAHPLRARGQLARPARRREHRARRVPRRVRRVRRRARRGGARALPASGRSSRPALAEEAWVAADRRARRPAERRRMATSRSTCAAPSSSARCGRRCARSRAGSTVTYSQLASAIGRPTATRAVAQACGGNPTAVVVPCHRVIGADGSLTGYRWGVERKRALLEREARRSQVAGPPGAVV